MTRHSARTRLLLPFLLACLLPALASADPLVIEELTVIDRQYLASQRASIEALAADNFGARFSGDRDRDIGLLQRLLDERLVRGDQTRQLQAMGVILGDLLAADLGMHWVIYKDDRGRSHALRYRDSDEYLFPVTMISRRREVGNTEAVADIYRNAAQALRQSIPRLPFTAP